MRSNAESTCQMNIRLATADAAAPAVLNAIMQKPHADAEPDLFCQLQPNIFTPGPVVEILAEPDNTILIAYEGDEASSYAWIKLQDRLETIMTHANCSSLRCITIAAPQ